MPSEFTKVGGDIPWVEWIIEHNKVVAYNNLWIMVENCKYHTKQHPHYTWFRLEQDIIKARVIDDEVAYRPSMYTLEDIINSTAWRRYYVYRNRLEDRSLEHLHFHIVMDFKRYRGLTT